MSYPIGSRVKYRATFLKSCAWHTDVPRFGTVTAEPLTLGGGITLVTVKWCDGHENRVNAKNLMPYGKPDYSGM